MGRDFASGVLCFAVSQQLYLQAQSLTHMGGDPRTYEDAYG